MKGHAHNIYHKSYHTMYKNMILTWTKVSYKYTTNLDEDLTLVQKERNNERIGENEDLIFVYIFSITSNIPPI